MPQSDKTFKIDGQVYDYLAWTAKAHKGWRWLKRTGRQAQKVLRFLSKVMDVAMDLLEIIEATVQREFGGARATAA